MKIKSFIATTLVMVCCVCMAGNAQAQTPDNLTLYTMYGQPKSCADNFESLFKAWGEENVSNAKELKFIEYKSLGKVTDSTQTKQYAEQMTTLDYAFISTAGVNSGGLGPKIKLSYIKFESMADLIASKPEQDKEKMKNELENILSDVRKMLCMEIKIGYEVFIVKSLFNGKPIESLVFCDPNTYEVMVDMHFKGIALK